MMDCAFIRVFAVVAVSLFRVFGLCVFRQHAFVPPHEPVVAQTRMKSGVSAPEKSGQVALAPLGGRSER